MPVSSSQLPDFFLRCTYHLYVSHVLKYRQYNELWEHDFDAIPDEIMDLLNTKETLCFLDQEKEKAAQLGIQILPFHHNDYPSALKKLKGMPPVLYTKSNTKIDLNQPFFIAIVGSRKASTYGKKYAFRFASELSALGFTIISGLAYGIDAESHKGALSQQGKTIAVVGTGVDLCYPKPNFSLMQSIENSGCILTEFPIGTPPKPYHFPSRNRIISGISDAVLLMEAAQKSGAMITADLALDQGKEVFALPGSIDSPTSQGTNDLIKQGVRVLTQVEDVTSLLGSPSRSELFDEEKTFESNEKKIVIALKQEDLDFSSLVDQLQIPSSELMKALTMLEIKGIIRKEKNVYSLFQAVLFS
ncbi:MAG TPA: DNA-processing protein DprA [Caldisericia bacterium]|nr:DNA-processing protein DprA [Caldisericia bacterium]HXK51726.1 DNA-processing protein DprA [Caldisericia bacterium]